MLQANKSEHGFIPTYHPPRQTFDYSGFDDWLSTDIDDPESFFPSSGDDEDNVSNLSSAGGELCGPVSAFERYDSNGHDSSSKGWQSADTSADGDSTLTGMPSTPVSILSALHHTPRVAANHHCSTCCKRFPALHLLERHAKDSGHKPFRCNELGCDKSYPRRDTCIRHIATHKQSSHVCRVCTMGTVTKAFVRKDHWLQHMRTCHGYDDSPFDRKHGCNQESQAPQEKRQHTARTSLAEALRNLAVHDERLSRLGEKYDLTRELNTEQLTQIFAALALVEPQGLSPETKQRLEQKAGRSRSS